MSTAYDDLQQQADLWAMDVRDTTALLEATRTEHERMKAQLAELEAAYRAQRAAPAPAPAGASSAPAPSSRAAAPARTPAPAAATARTHTPAPAGASSAPDPAPAAASAEARASRQEEREARVNAREAGVTPAAPPAAPSSATRASRHEARAARQAAAPAEASSAPAPAAGTSSAPAPAPARPRAGRGGFSTLDSQEHNLLQRTHAQDQDRAAKKRKGQEAAAGVRAESKQTGPRQQRQQHRGPKGKRPVRADSDSSEDDDESAGPCGADGCGEPILGGFTRSCHRCKTKLHRPSMCEFVVPDPEDNRGNVWCSTQCRETDRGSCLGSDDDS